MAHEVGFFIVRLFNLRISTPCIWTTYPFSLFRAAFVLWRSGAFRQWEWMGMDFRFRCMAFKTWEVQQMQSQMSEGHEDASDLLNEARSRLKMTQDHVHKNSSDMQMLQIRQLQRWLRWFSIRGAERWRSWCQLRNGRCLRSAFWSGNPRQRPRCRWSHGRCANGCSTVKRMSNEKSESGCQIDVNHDVFVKGDEAAEWLSRALQRGQPRLLRRVQSCRRSAAGPHWPGSPGG